MAIKHTISILLSKFDLVYKMILFFFIVALIIAAICVGAIAPKINPLYNAISDTGLFSEFSQAVSKLFKGDDSFIESFGNAAVSFEESKQILLSSAKAFTSSLVIIAVLSFVLRFVTALAAIPFSDIVNNFMNSKSKYGFLSNFVANIKKSLIYSTVFSLIVFPINCLIIVGIYYLAVALFSAAPFFALPLTFVVAVLVISLKMVIFSGWIPAIVYDNKGVLDAFIYGFKVIKKNFFNAYWSFVSAITLCFAFGLLFSIATFGVGVIIGIPVLLMFSKILELVIYYNSQNYHYYIDKTTVIEMSFYD